jgi:hypothetical protein
MYIKFWWGNLLEHDYLEIVYLLSYLGNSIHIILISSPECEKNEAHQNSELSVTVDTTEQELSNFPLAVKMMFNYDAESNATSILRAMYRETVPAKYHFINEELSSWEKR